MKKLPLGIQSFKEIRTKDYLYIDKTELLYRLTTFGKYYFLSRPRRFGKSLTISTLEELFLGNKELFKGLWIEDQWNWNHRNPILRLDFSNMDFKNQSLEKALSRYFLKIADDQNINLPEGTYIELFKNLIENLGKTGQVVLLIDEYDKPVVDFLGGQEEEAKRNQLVLKGLFSIIKPHDEYFRFVFLTGVSKFSYMSVFSVLNNLRDITLSNPFNDLCGYTQQELEANFEDYITETATHLEMTRPKLLQEIKAWYNGYNWTGRNRIYNPFSILNFFLDQSFENFWFRTGTPTFLINLLKERGDYNISNHEVGYSFIESFSLDHIGTFSLLVQTGYLTIKKNNPKVRSYLLDYPNQEVKESFLQYLVGAYSSKEPGLSTPAVLQLRSAFLDRNIEGVMELINSMFASIPYQIFKQKSEAYYHSLIHLMFVYLGQYIESEVNTNKGRCDAIVQTDSAIYILEFKLDQTADTALKQIKEKAYQQQFLTSGKTISLIGINFSSDKKEIEDWKVEHISASNLT